MLTIVTATTETSADDSIVFRGFLFLIKNSGGSVLHAIKGRLVSLDGSKLKSENETFHF